MRAAIITICLAAALQLAGCPYSYTPEPVGLRLRYEFKAGESIAADTMKEFDGILAGTAELTTENGVPVLNLGDQGYVDMGMNLGAMMSALNDFTIATYVYIPAAADISQNDSGFLWSFASSENVGTRSPCMFFRLNSRQFTISKSGSTGESYLWIPGAPERDKWQHILFRMNGSDAETWVNGVMINQGNRLHPAVIKPSELGFLSFNWIGRSCYNPDRYLKNARYSDFRIYEIALSSEDIANLDIGATLAKLNGGN